MEKIPIGSSAIKEYKKTLTTYPFSLSNPVAPPANIYPYFRFDGFTDKPEQKEWKIVELENDFIKVLIIPEIGGKIWTAINKKNGKPFIYNNDVVKFRDIGMRGPWTSGGIEINYGAFGHTPGVATPVNYLNKKNRDGSASCILSLLDLLTGTRWSLEIRLPKDKAYFVTRSLWHNESGVYQSYYSWMNAGQKVSGGLKYIFPGNQYVFYDGNVFSWPKDKKTGKNTALYDQNDFGGSKSYHVTGVYGKYFGVYWQKEDIGMVHYAPRQDKIGKKIWIWGLSRQGMIWEDILTDHAGQYTEIQSGRLYNQNIPESVLTPFKQFYFMPYNTDTWDEYWYPVQNTGGITSADLNGVINLKQDNENVKIYISPVSYINDTLNLIDDNGKIIYSKPLKLNPLQFFHQKIPIQMNCIRKVILGNSIIDLQDSDRKVLNRPLKAFPDFDWGSAYGLYLKGKYESGSRRYDEAEKYICASIEKQPFFMPALIEMAFLQYRKMNYASSFDYASRALSIDTYDSAANYYYGLAALKLDKWYDAMDGFEMAPITPQYRSAAYNELSKMHFKKQNNEEAYLLATKSITNNTMDITALQLKYLASRLRGYPDKGVKKNIIKLDPLNHFVRFENYWQNRTERSKKGFISLIRDELPQHTYLNLAIWYYNVDRKEECREILEICPVKNNEILYWLAYLHRDNTNVDRWLDKAERGEAYFVFPYRAESVAVMQWAIETTKSWKPKYYLALIKNFYGFKAEALNYLKSIKEQQVNFAPLYILKARLRDSSDVDNILKDYKAAAYAGKEDYRYGMYLSEYMLSLDDNQGALRTVEPYYKNNPGNYILGMLYVKCLMLNDQYETAEKVLNGLHILPCEGEIEGRKFYKQIKLMLALKLIQKYSYRSALQKVNESREWPEHLGVGKPFSNMIDSTLPNDIERFIRQSEKSHKLNNDDIMFYISKVKSMEE